MHQVEYNERGTDTAVKYAQTTQPDYEQTVVGDLKLLVVQDQHVHIPDYSRHNDKA